MTKHTTGPSLTKAEAAALLLVRDGADVTGYALALTYRAIQRKAPALITIGPVEGNYGNGVGIEPYFGCIATAAGLVAAERTLRMRRKP